jgi:hypothetical protein
MAELPRLGAALSRPFYRPMRGEPQAGGYASGTAAAAASMPNGD